MGFLEEWDLEKTLVQERRDIERRGEKRMSNQVARAMLKDGDSIDKIISYSSLTEEAILSLAKIRFDLVCRFVIT